MESITPKRYQPLLALEKRIIESGMWFDCHDSDGPCKPVGVKEFRDNSPLLVVLVPRSLRETTVRLTDLLGSAETWESLVENGNLVVPSKSLVRKVENADDFTEALYETKWSHSYYLKEVQRKKKSLSRDRLLRSALAEYAKNHPDKAGKCFDAMPMKMDSFWYEIKERDESSLKEAFKNLQAVRTLARGVRTKNWPLAKLGAAAFTRPVDTLGKKAMAALSSLPPESGLSVETEKGGWNRSYFVIDGAAHMPWEDTP